MRFVRPEQIGLVVAVLTGSALWVLLSTPWYNEVPRFWVSFVFAALVGIAVSWMVQRFLFERLKTIYRVLRDPKRGGLKENKLPSSMSDVEKEVAEWTASQQSEIQLLENREGFRREFMSNLSHELKTTIFNIQGYLLTLIDGGLEDEKINRKYLEKAAKSVERMITLIQDMDALTRLESGQFEIQMGVVDIVKVMKEVVEDLDPMARKAHVGIILKKNQERLYKAQGDAKRIEQVFQNLLSNAIKYSQPSAGFVRLDIHDMEDHFLIEVADNGMGIPEQDLSRIFERFYRVEKSRSRDVGGTGLGLAIVKHIVEGHGQTIHATSTVGVGSVFSFTLKKAK